MTLFILSNTFTDEQSPELLVAQGVSDILETMDGIIGESERATRRYLIKMMAKKSEKARSMPIHILNEHSHPKEVEELVRMVQQGGVWGIVTDAGLPCVADPGALLIQELRRHGYEKIHAIGGACSFMMALQLSGFSGQRFSFLGYLPCNPDERKKMIRKKEEESRQEQCTEICMETPYRNAHLYTTLVETLSPETLLCVAQEVGTPQQSVHVHTVSFFRKNPLVCSKVPTVFLWKAYR